MGKDETQLKKKRRKINIWVDVFIVLLIRELSLFYFGLLLLISVLF